MKSKVLNFLLILTSVIGFLEWGKDRKLFLFQAEAEIISKLFTDPVSVIHPFTLLPLVGQIILLTTLFQKKPNKVLTFISIGGLGENGHKSRVFHSIVYKSISYNKKNTIGNTIGDQEKLHILML